MKLMLLALLFPLASCSMLERAREYAPHIVAEGSIATPASPHELAFQQIGIRGHVLIITRARFTGRVVDLTTGFELVPRGTIEANRWFVADLYAKQRESGSVDSDALPAWVRGTDIETAATERGLKIK